MVKEKKYNYDIKRGAEIYSAISFTRLRNWIRTGRISLTETVVRKNGLSGWCKVNGLIELAPLIKEQVNRCHPQAAEAELVKVPPRPARGGKKIQNILLVDDEKDLCALLAGVLERRKYQVGIANTIKDALAWLKKHTPDLVFLDLKLPDGDGTKLIAKIKKSRPGVIINIISAFDDDENKTKVIKLGANEFIGKPFTGKDILKILKKQTG